MFYILRGEIQGSKYLKEGHHLPALFRWAGCNGLTLNIGLVTVIFQGIWTNIAKKPIALRFFRGSGPPVTPPPPPPLDLHMTEQMAITSDTQTEWKSDNDSFGLSLCRIFF